MFTQNDEDNYNFIIFVRVKLLTVSGWDDGKEEVSSSMFSEDEWFTVHNLKRNENGRYYISNHSSLRLTFPNASSVIRDTSVNRMSKFE